MVLAEPGSRTNAGIGLIHTLCRSIGDRSLFPNGSLPRSSDYEQQLVRAEVRLLSMTAASSPAAGGRFENVRGARHEPFLSAEHGRIIVP